MKIPSATAVENAAISAAQNLPSLVSNLKEVDSPLAQQLETKSLLASKSPWGTLLAGIVGWLSTRYGLGFDADMSALIAGVCVLAGSYVMRLLTKQPATITPPKVPSYTTGAST